MSNHLIDALGIAGEARSDRVFARLPDGRHYSYGDVDAVSARFATALQALGVAPGDRVAVQVEKSIEALMLYLGTVRAGAIFLPLNTAYTADEVAYFLENAEPSLFVCDPARAGALGPVAAKARARLETMGVWQPDGGDYGTLFGHLPEHAPGFRNVERGADDLAAILYTSGTTGRSKGAMLSHANLASNSATLAEYWRFTAEDVLIHALPIFHTHGLFVAVNVTLIAGGSLILMPKFDADAVLAAMPEATAMMGVPTFYTRLLDHDGLTREATAGMRLFVSGSAPLLAETHDRWRARTGHAILERYGMTETNMNSSNPYDGERRAGTVGFPLPGVDLRITDLESAADLPRGAAGMIEVRGPNVFRGYWRMPEKTAEELRPDGWFITGDIGMIGEDGYLSIVGRAKDLIIAGGYNIYPKEIETLIDAIPGVAESAVIGLPHADFGESVAAVIVREGAAPDADAVKAALEGRLARFKQPRDLFFVDSLPRNAMGKVQKAELRKRYGR